MQDEVKISEVDVGSRREGPAAGGEQQLFALLTSQRPDEGAASGFDWASC